MHVVEDSSGITVIVTVDAEPAIMTELIEHASQGLDMFPEYDGYVAGALHVSEDRSRLVQMLQWRSKEAYSACIEAPRWDELETTQAFLEHVREGRAEMAVHVVDVVKTTQAGVG